MAGAPWGAGELRASTAPKGVIDLGVVKSLAAVTNGFAVENTATEAATITAVTPSCDCVQILSFPERLAPGEKGRVEFVFVPGGAGPIQVEVTVDLEGSTSVREVWNIQADVKGIEGRRANKVASDIRPEALVRRIRAMDRSSYEPAAHVVDGAETSGWTIVDVRDPESFNRMHAAGALNMPLFAVKTAGFLRGRKVLLMDQGYGAAAVEEECQRLKSLGFGEVRILEGGLNGWVHSRGAVEGSAVAASDPSVLMPAELFEARRLETCVVVLADVARSSMAHALLPEGVDLPFTTGDSAYGSRVQAVLKRVAPHALLVVATEEGQNYGAIAEALRGVDADVFYLGGGVGAYRDYLETVSRGWQGGHTETVVSSGTAGPGTSGAKPCGSCPR